MNIRDTQTAITESIGLDAVIDNTRFGYITELDWLDAAYGRAFLLRENTANGGVRFTPKILTGNAPEYFEVMPNDALGSHVFFIGRNEASPGQETTAPLQKTRMWQQRVDIIFYFNLHRIDPDKSYYFIEELKRDVVEATQKQRGIIIDEIYTETLEEVYEGFTLSELSRDLLYYPYAGMRLSTRMTYSLDSCFDIETALARLIAGPADNQLVVVGPNGEYLIVGI